jgi:hypothetical protein
MEPWPEPVFPDPIPPAPRKKKGWNGIDVAALIFVIACLVIFLAAALPQ